MCFCCITPPPQNENTICLAGVDLEARIWKTYGRVESHRAAALVCLVTSSARGGDAQMGLVIRSDWLLQLRIYMQGEEEVREGASLGMGRS